MQIELVKTGELLRPFTLRIQTVEAEQEIRLSQSDAQQLIESVRPFADAMTVSHQDCENILVCAIEGGSNYWISDHDGHYWEGCLHKHDRDNPDCDKTKYDYNCTCVKTFKNGGDMLIYESEADQYGNDIDKELANWHRLTLDMLKEGIARAAAHNGQSVQTFMDDHDANDADLALQYALFGAVIYG